MWIINNNYDIVSSKDRNLEKYNFSFINQYHILEAASCFKYVKQKHVKIK